MVTTIKEHVTVGAGGRIELQSSQLREGDSVEVTVTVERPASSSEDRLAAFEALRNQLNLTAEQAKAWTDEVTAERKASRRPNTQR